MSVEIQTISLETKILPKHYEFIPDGSTVNKEMYVKILCHFRDVVRGKYVEECAGFG
jgi:hypothetical protein